MAGDPQPQLEVVVASNERSEPTSKPQESKPSADQKDQDNEQPSKWRKINPLRWQKTPPVPQEREVTREYGAGILSIILFEWITPFMKVGYLRQLESLDIWKVHPKRAADVVSDKLDAALKSRMESGSRQPLLWALYDTFKKDFIIGGICQLVSMMCMILAPYVVRYLIAFATEAYEAHYGGLPEPGIGHGMGFAIGIFLLQVIQSWTINQAFYRGMLVGGLVKAALTSKVFNKAMKLSNRAKAGGKPDKEEEDEEEESVSEKDASKSRKQKAKKKQNGLGWSNGRITTLMGVDVDRVDKACGMFHMLWVSPVALVVALVILVVNIGYSALAGYALLVLGTFGLTYAFRVLVRFRVAINKITEQRVSLTQEILYSARFVKFFGWESSFLERLEETRRREINSITRLLTLRHAVVVCLMSLPTFASLLSFVTYALSNHGLSAARIFSSFALFNVLRMPLSMMNLTITQVTDGWTAIERIEEFLLAEERKDVIDWDANMENAIEVKGASFTWEQVPGTETKTDKPDLKRKDGSGLKAIAAKASLADNQSDTTEQTPFKLTDVSFEVGRNELLAVIGTVGCGKSSLLGALAGDMRLTTGNIKMGANRAFCPQYAWIQNTTVRNNILFGKEYDEEFYDKVIDACALRADLAIFPDGDQTEIGERGITVSGGQKQRLNIARAVYSRAKIVLMDDPLSAVDAHVGRQIMDEAICGLLSDRCRVLATHQLHVLSRCDRIIVMKEGCIDAIDTFDNLLHTNEHFKSIMSNISQQEESDEDHDDGNTGADTEKKKEEETVADKSTPGKPGSGALMQKEERGTGSVSWDIWKAYISATGPPLLTVVAFFVLLGCVNGGIIMTGLWVSYWTADKFPNLSMGQYMGIYAAICCAQALSLYAFSLHVTTSAARASKTMLQRAMYRVLRAPMSFFDTTPLGRITNRFSRDVQVMDSDLGEAMRMFAFAGTQIFATMILVIAFYYYFAIAIVPLLLLLLLASSYYGGSARNLKRHDAVLRSAVFARFGEAISGTSSIQAYKMEEYFQQNLHEAIDSANGAYFLTFANQRWVAIRIDAIGSILILVVGILVVSSRFNVGPSTSGLVLSYVLGITQGLQFTVRQFAEVGNNMNSTERLHYYGTMLDEEAPLHLAKVDPSWPEKGRLIFSDVQMRYRDGLPLVLRGLTMDIQGGERIGIVGRTGAGKSSIMTALFRLTELSGGSIQIDGIDIATVGLHDLRSRLAIIPQDPTLFRGTIRSNLDPFNEHTDMELWDALRKADLVGRELPEEDGSITPTSMNEEQLNEKQLNEKQLNEKQLNEKQLSPNRLTLDTVVDEEGLNFSLGQRQLMALARALVRDARIIVCDEATSSVDFETDQRVQDTMAQGFKGKTLLCIAHRLRTIINYDRICVMDKGQIAEMDTPLALWEKPDGIFRSMCDQSGITREDIEGL